MGVLTWLLDTHALLWAVADPSALSARVRDLLVDEANMLLVSSASAWEIATKHRLGRLPDAAILLDAFREHLHQLRAEELPISVPHALASARFASAHRDPFDRILAAQALVEGVPLVSRDAVFRDFPIQTFW